MNKAEKGVKFGAERMMAQLDEFYHLNPLSEEGDHALELMSQIDELVKARDWPEVARLIVEGDSLINEKHNINAEVIEDNDCED